MDTPHLILQATISGLLMGGMFALIAIGLTLVVGVMKVMNFAHCALMMVGMYVSFWCFTFGGIDPYFSILFTFPLLFILGWVIQRHLFERIVGRAHHAQLLLALGILLVIENVALLVCKPDPRIIQLGYSGWTIPLGALTLSFSRFIAFVLAIAMVTALYLFLKRTDLGKAIRASADNREGALIIGIHVKKVHRLAFGISSACAGMAGSILLPFFYVHPHIGNVFLLPAFVIIVLGGMGSFFGALLGAFVVGVVESLGSVLISPEVSRILTLMIFILVLLFKPTGLFKH